MRFPIPRRRILGLFISLVALAPRRPLATSRPGTGRTIPTATLGAFLDTLLPDDVTPSATQLAVDTALLVEARPGTDLARLIEPGCRWLDEQANRRGEPEFANLEQSDRDEIVVLAESSPPASLPNRFFRTVRDRAFLRYYANAASWKGLGFLGPPQPEGFPTFTQPPDANRR